MTHRFASNPSTERRYFFDEGLRFECTGCGKCCTGEPGQVLVGAVECGKIADYLGIPVGEFMHRHTREVADGTSLTERSNGDCVFLENGSCAIHAVKPVQCGTFPFWQKNLRSEESWERTVARCEGIGRGRLYPRDEILALVNQEKTRTERA